MAKRYRKPRVAAIPYGETLVLGLDPLRCSYKLNHDIRSGNFVYAVRGIDSDYVKFGATKSPWSRLNDLQVGGFEEYDLALLIDCGHDFGRVGVERAVHQALGRSRIRGEWFDGEDPAVKQIIEKPWTLPWKVIEGMVRLGTREALKKSNNPMHVRPAIEERKLAAVKTQFMAWEWGKP